MEKTRKAPRIKAFRVAQQIIPGMSALQLKKAVICIIIIVNTLLLCSCGISAASEATILQDIETKSPFANFSVETTDFSIIKRQTNADEKTDIVYICISGENEDYAVTRNYKMTYILYNDGWILENVDDYHNADNPNLTTPLHGINREEAIHCAQSLSLENYCGMDVNTGYITEFLSDPYESYLPMNEYGECELPVRITFSCGPFNEQVTFPVYFQFYGYDNISESYSWHPIVYEGAISREYVFNEGILGTWGNSNSWLSIAGEMTVDEYDGNRCHVSSFYTKYFSTSGWLYLEQDYPGDLRWESDSNNSKSPALFFSSPAILQLYNGTLTGEWEKIQ